MPRRGRLRFGAHHMSVMTLWVHHVLSFKRYYVITLLRFSVVAFQSASFACMHTRQPLPEAAVPRQTYQLPTLCLRGISTGQ